MKKIKSIWNILTKKEKININLLIVLMLFGGFLEIIGIGAIIPIIGLIASPELIKNNPAMTIFIDFLGNPNDIYLLIYLLMVFLIFVILKNIFSLFVIKKTNTVTFNHRQRIATLIFNNFLNMNYTKYINNNSSYYINIILKDIPSYDVALRSAMSLLTNIIICISISLFLIIREPIAFFSIFILLGSSLYFLEKYYREIITKLGKSSQVAHLSALKTMQESLNAIKEIIITNSRKYFSGYFNQQYNMYVDSFIKWSTIQKLPRYFSEIVIVVGLNILVIIYIIIETSMPSMLISLGLFAFAAMRIMPAAVGIMSGFQAVGFSLAGIDQVLLVIGQLIPNKENKYQFSDSKILAPIKKIELKKINYRYPNTDKIILNNITISLIKGESFGIVGESGAGKTTLINIILGLILPNTGSVMINGESNINDDINGWRKNIGYVPQSIYLLDDTIRKNIAFGIPNEKIVDYKINKAIKLAQLEKLVDELPEGINTFVGERGNKISTGQLQRIGIARALYNDPEILILDEATSSLDIKTEANVMKDVSQLKGEKTLVIITHRFSTLDNCDKIYQLSNGKLKKVIIGDENKSLNMKLVQ